MKFSEIETKGLAKVLAAQGLVPDKLRIHISQVEPGKRSHEAHAHTGVEAFHCV